MEDKRYYVTVSSVSLWIRAINHQFPSSSNSNLKVVEIDKSLFDFLKSQLNFVPEYGYEGCYSWKDYGPRG